MSKKTVASFALALASIVLGGCGGSTPTAAEPEAPAATPPASDVHESHAEGADAGSQGEHTMPDGTKMPGHHHEEAAPAPADEPAEK